MTSTGALTAYSGSKTGRSPLDKRVVKEESSEKDIWWGPVNKAMTPEVSAHVNLIQDLPRQKCSACLPWHLQSQDPRISWCGHEDTPNCVEPHYDATAEASIMPCLSVAVAMPCVA